MIDFLEAEAAIRQVHARYADAVWRKDYDALGDCCTEDMEWRIGGRIFQGRSVIVSHLQKLFPRFERIFLTFRTPIVCVTDEEISARTYVSEQSVYTDGRSLFAIGIYYDRFVIENGRARFAWRLFEAQYAGAPDLSAPFFETVDYGAPPAMPALDAETVDVTGNHRVSD